MAKYNPRKEQHRKWLAQNIIKICLAYGFILDFNRGDATKELVFIKTFGEYKVYVFTSVDTRTREIRRTGSDAIRVITHNNDPIGSMCRFSRNINRVGHFKRIGDRLAEAIRIATWNAENPDKPRWNGLKSHSKASKYKKKKGWPQKK